MIYYNVNYIQNILPVIDIVYNALIIWGDRHLDKSYKCISHDGCQGEIEIVYRCKECGEIINKEDLKIAPKE